MEKLTQLRAALEVASERASRPTATVFAETEVAALRDIICFAIPIFNLIGPMFGLPVLPLPAFCNK